MYLYSEGKTNKKTPLLQWVEDQTVHGPAGLNYSQCEPWWMF